MITSRKPTDHTRTSSPLLLGLGALALVAALALAASLALAGCGGRSGSGSTGAYGGPGATGGAEAPAGGAQSAESSHALVAAAGVSGLGSLLVDSENMTLYDFAKDKGTMSSCYGACAEAWPPLLTKGMPSSNGTSQAKLGMTSRKDGSEQVTYAGHPLYTFSGDNEPGEANGNNVDAFGAEWYALHPDGSDAEGHATATSPPGGGY